MQNPLQAVTFRSNHASNKAKCGPEWCWNPRQPLPDYDLWYVAEGTGRIVLENREYPLCPGTCMLVRPGQIPYAEQDLSNRLIVIFMHFSAEIQGEDAHFFLPPECTLLDDRYAFEHTLHRLLEVDAGSELWKADEFDCLMKIAWMKLYRLFLNRGRTIPLSFDQIQTVKKIIDYIRVERPNGMDHRKLSELAQLSPAYLNILFKQYTGASLKTFITRNKLQYAHHMLSETSLSISQIAEDVGYSDIYAFSKMYKKYFGVTPSSTRKHIPESAEF